MIIKLNSDEYKDYLTDASCFEGFCEELVVPENEAELVSYMKSANRDSKKITVAAAGTGLTGSRVPLGGTIVSMEKFDKILNLSNENKTLSVQSFVRLFEIQDFLAGSGLFYPPNPTEKLASIGGNIGNNASGSRTYLYGATRKYVERLRIVLPQGDILDLRRGEIYADGLHFSFESNEGNKYCFDVIDLDMPNVKHAAGYFFKKNMDLIDLFIGAEGTLGIITEVEIRLLPSPELVAGAIIFFDTHDGMYDFISSLKSEISTISPRLIEFFDDNSLNFLKQKISQIPDKAHYALWIEIETNSKESDFTLENIYKCASKHSNLADETWVAQNDSEHKRLAEFRHALPLAVYEKIQEYKQQKLGTDSAVPDIYVKSYHEEIINLCESRGLDYVIWGHIGNSHFHANIITKSENEFIAAKDIYESILVRAVELGGTVSAEHGIGKIKKQYLKMLYGEKEIDAFRQVKKAIDPNLLLNIGNIFDL